MAKTVKKNKWAKFVDRWHDIRERRAKVDYDTSELAFEVRAEFPGGAGGDLQFRIWCVRNLEVMGSTASMLLRAVRVYDMFEESDWYDMGGWSSLQFLSTLQTQGRKKVINACRNKVLERLERGGKRTTIGYTTVKNIAYSLGVQSDRLTGRPNRLAVEENLGFCRNWLKTLYEQYSGLPKMPKAVTKAMGGTKLSRIAAAAKAG